MPTSKSNRVKVGVTIGDPKGIGPEIVAKALNEISVRSLADFTIIGDERSFNKYFKRKFRNCDLIALGDGQQMPAGECAYHFLLKAVELLKAKKIQTLVTAPVCKENICKYKKRFQGHTEFLSESFDVENVGMLFVAKEMKTIIVTRHIPIKKVSRALNVDIIYETIALTEKSLKNNFKVKAPRIGVCGLNPHAGEGGLMGREDEEIILPAINKARSKGIRCAGPFAADTLFVGSHGNQYDAIVAMYHDQGLIPIKTLYFDKLVNLTIGLPFIRTSPAHGTAFDIAGKNKANPSSMIEAIRLAVRLSS